MFKVPMILLFVGTLVSGMLAFGATSTRQAVAFDIAFIVLLAACVTSWIFAMARQLDSVASQDGYTDRTRHGSATNHHDANSRSDR